MSGNDITKEGARKISEILKINRSLQVFNVSYNKLYDDGAVAIIECLKTNATLIELDLSHNYITDQITTKISEPYKLTKHYKYLIFHTTTSLIMEQYPLVKISKQTQHW